MTNPLSPRSLLFGGVCWCLCSAGRRRAVMARVRRGGPRYGHIKSYW
jgi:hypothetical protein